MLTVVQPDTLIRWHRQGWRTFWRMSMRRFIRLTNAFAKKWENLVAMATLYFIKLHYTSYTTTSGGCIRRFALTPAMEAGVSDHVWAIEEIVALLEYA